MKIDVYFEFLAYFEIITRKHMEAMIMFFAVLQLTSQIKKIIGTIWQPCLCPPRGPCPQFKNHCSTAMFSLTPLTVTSFV